MSLSPKWSANKSHTHMHTTCTSLWGGRNNFDLPKCAIDRAKNWMIDSALWWPANCSQIEIESHSLSLSLLSLLSDRPARGRLRQGTRKYETGSLSGELVSFSTKPTCQMDD